LGIRLPGYRLFISYSHRDDVLRAKLQTHLSSLKQEGLISTWDDRRLVAGAEWDTDIMAEVDSADIIVFLISDDFLASQYCIGKEATRAIERRNDGSARVVPVIVRPVDWRMAPIGLDPFKVPLGLLNALPQDARPIVEWPSVDAGMLNVATGLRAVVDDLRQRDQSPPHRARYPPAPPATALVPAQAEARHPGQPHRAASKLAERLALSNITFFVGSRIDRRGTRVPPAPRDIAEELLAELQLVPRGNLQLLPPLDVAAAYYAIKHGTLGLERKVADLMGVMAAEPSAVDLQLVATVRAIRDYVDRLQHSRVRTMDRLPLVIATTNVDLTLERALLSEGVEFSRIVQHHDEPRLTVCEYRGFQRLASCIVAPFGAAGSVEIPLHDTVRLEALIANWSSRTIGSRPYRVSEGLPDTDSTPGTLESGGNQNPAAALPLRGLTSPILYKLSGSQDVEGSCGLSTDQHALFLRRLASAFVPTQIRRVVNQSALVFLGYGYLEPDFRLVYETFEGELVTRRVDYPMYWVQTPPPSPPRDSSGLVESCMWDDLKDAGPRKAKMTMIEEDPERFLVTLLERIAALRVPAA
jgi:hypothetical protein